MHAPGGPEIRAEVVSRANGFRGKSTDTVGSRTDVLRLHRRDACPVASNASRITAPAALHVTESRRRGKVKTRKGS